MTSKKWVVLSVLAMSLAVSAVPLQAATKQSGMTVTQMQNKIRALQEENKVLKAVISQLTGKPYTGAAATNSSSDGSFVDKPATSNLTGTHFTDLANLETKPMIDDLAKLGVFKGMGNEFHPYQPITRGEYVAWLYRAYNLIRGGGDRIRLAGQLGQQFADVPLNHPAYSYVQSLANAGYAIGYGDRVFRPDQPITREEMIAMKVAVDIGKDELYSTSISTTWNFADTGAIDPRYTRYINMDFYSAGPRGNNVLRAFGRVTNFQPKSPVLRHEAAATLWQMDRYGHTATAEKALLRANIK